ncbi:hypothetical protein CCACVL1_20511 [Corchorus capsularis]|uniref:Protein kinase domain-containing protein n=1 Tax=Corchorus capsularis TaxID=210143 RepID=A0A1R3HAS8_COCAP|nr:hypothetical protein CCACVL1_20511 [Corchorus capsularis]
MDDNVPYFDDEKSLFNRFYFALSTTWADVLKVLEGVAKGIQSLHDKGFVHADLKHDNIFITEHFVVKVGDLAGVIRDGQQSQITTGKYVPPEAENSRTSNIHKSSDIFSYDVIMIQLIMKEDTTTLDDGGGKRGKRGKEQSEGIVQRFERFKSQGSSVVYHTLTGCPDAIIDLAIRCTSFKNSLGQLLHT